MVTEKFLSLEQQLGELEDVYRYKTFLSVADLRNIFGWSKTTAYSKIAEGVFIPFGDVPKDAKKVHKRIVFQYFKSLF